MQDDAGNRGERCTAVVDRLGIECSSCNDDAEGLSADVSRVFRPGRRSGREAAHLINEARRKHDFHIDERRTIDNQG